MSDTDLGPPGSLRAEVLIERARKQAELEDFGDEWFLEPFHTLIDHLNAEGDLVSNDVEMVHKLVDYLADRLRMQAFVDAHPEVHDERIEVAGVIVGLARGGSTLAQRLLGASPQLTSVYKYDVCAPLPLPGERLGDTAPRIARCQRQLDELAARWPDMASMHPMTPMDYEEEIELMDRSFTTIMYGFYFHLPKLMRRLFDYDDRKTYEELILWLKILQLQDPSRRGMPWLLKSPQHMMGGQLRNCMAAFPDAKILMTHRHLKSVVGSSTSMRYSMLKEITRELDPADVGAESIESHLLAFERLIEIRDESPADRFVDLQYADVVADPVGQFEYALDRMGVAVGPADLRAAESWMEAHARDTHPPHHYRIEDYGIDPDRFEKQFAFYHDRFLKPAA